MPVAKSIERIPPQNIEAEKSVIGAMLLNNDVVGDIIQILEPEDYYKSAHGIIYRSIIELFDKKEPIDIVILRNHLRNEGLLEEIGGTEYLPTLAESVTTSANAEYHARIVKEKSVARKLINVCTKIIQNSYNESIDADTLVDSAESEIFEVSKWRDVRESTKIKDVIKETFVKLESIHERKGRLTGLSTGFYELDDLTSGLQDSELIIIAGRPSMGKTSLALRIIENFSLKEKIPVAFFSLETSAQQIAMNLICSHAKIDAQRLRQGKITEEESQRLMMAAHIFSETQIFIDDTSAFSTRELSAKARRLKSQHDIQAVIIDYLQLMSAPRTATNVQVQNRQQEISMISRYLKALARQLQVPVIALSQLSRAVESREGNKPRLSDLRESGAIEQDADVVMLLYRAEYYDPEKEPGITELIIAKQRNGPTGLVKLQFEKRFMRFENLSLYQEKKG